MSRSIEDRVWAAHPLPAGARLVLAAIARAVPEGAQEVMINRRVLAEDLELPTSAVARALVSGTYAGVCEVTRAGLVSFANHALPLDECARHTPADTRSASFVKRPATPGVTSAPAATRGTNAGQAVMQVFAEAWQAEYRQQYVFTPGKDHKLAATLARALSVEEITRRIGLYLRHSNPFYRQCAHSFGVFARAVNDVAASPARRSASDGIPDANETARYLGELREACRRTDHTEPQ